MSRPGYSLQRQDSTAARSDHDDADVFADRYALEDADLYAPGSMSRRSSTTSDGGYHAITTSTAVHHSPEQHTALSSGQQRELRNSIRKSRGFLENPFGSHQDEESAGPSTSSGFTPHIADDDESTFADSHSLYRDGPSHDYSGYTQNTAATTLTRSPTVPSIITTQSTGRQSLHGPAHPYNMYPQNVDEDLDDTSSQVSGPARSQPANARIPVGFPPQLLAPSRFRHDADNLSEQLPPYSEYPEDGAPKHVHVPPRVVEVPTPTSASTSHTVLPIAAVPQSMSDSPQTEIPPSEASLISHDEKSWRQKTWKEKRKTKFCGIPFGWIVLAFGVILFIVVACSAIIGGLLNHWQHQHHGPNNRTLVDAHPLQATHKLLPTGMFQLQLGSPQETESNCVTDQSQSGVWDCGISSPGSMAMNVATMPDGKGQTAYLYKAVNSTQIGYGTEIPETVAAPLKLVTDLDLPTMGSAYQFQVSYTKSVVVPGGLLQPATVNIASARSVRMEEPDITKRFWAPLTQPGDQPWFCYWNSTIVEGFIYVNQNSTSWYSNSSWRGMQGGSGGGNGWHHSWGPPPPPPTSTAQSSSYNKRTEPLTAANPSQSAQNPSSIDSAVAVTANLTSPTSSSTTGPSCTYSHGTMYGATPTESGSVCPPQEGHDAWSQLPLYPLVVKIEERRIPGDQSQPYCIKMQILADGTPATILDPHGNPYRQTVAETNPSLAAYANVYGQSTQDSSKKKRALVQGACHCQWISGEEGH